MIGVLSTVWTFLKSNWRTIVTIIAVTVVALWLRNQQQQLADAMKQVNDSHQLALDEINRARAKEAEEHARQLKEYKDALAKIEADYAAAQAELATRTKKHQDEIVQRYGNDMDGLATLAATTFGFTVVR